MATTTNYADPQFNELAGSINQFMTNEAIKPYIANLPGYANMVGQRSENTASQLKGQLPQDVVNQIAQQASQRGVGSGQTGGSNTNTALMALLGTNSTQQMQIGGQNLSQMIADTPVPQLFNPASMIVPNWAAQQELTAARTGGTPSGTGGRTVTAGVSGMPNLGGGAPIPAYDPGPNMWVGASPGMQQPVEPNTSWYVPNGQTSTGQPSTGGYGGFGFSTNSFDPTSHMFATGGQYGGSVDWAGVMSDPNRPSGWENQNWGGAFNEIDAGNPENWFMFE